MLQFDKMPTAKPANGSEVVAGRFAAKVFKTQMMVSKTTNNEYLNVSFKLKDGGFVNENYFDSDKPFLQYKLGRLLRACKVQLEGEGTLKDVAKVIADKDVIIDVEVNDRGYGSLDYSKDKEGIYMPDEFDNPFDVPEIGEEVTIDPEVNQAIEAELDTDEDF